MKSKVGNITRGLIACISITLIVLVLCNNAIYLHTHKTKNGELIIHAHPFNKAKDTSPYKKHQHSKEELFFLDNITLLFPLLFLALSIILVATKSGRVSNKPYNYLLIYQSAINGRAPPTKAY